MNDSTSILEHDGPGPIAAETGTDADWNEDEGLVDSPADQPGAFDPSDQPEWETQAGDKSAGHDKADQPDTFTLKHLDEVKTVGRDEVVTLAQKGMDYDRIRAARDELQGKVDQTKAAHALVEEYAKRNGMTVPEYLDYCREQALVTQGVSQETAKARVALDKERERISAEAQRVLRARAPQEVAAQEAQARKQSFAEFYVVYPEVKPDAVPKEVWAQVAKGVPLITAYTKHENQRLKAELAAQRQNKANVGRTTGSQVSAGEHSIDPFEEGWGD